MTSEELMMVLELQIAQIYRIGRIGHWLEELVEMVLIALLVYANWYMKQKTYLEHLVMVVGLEDQAQLLCR